MRILSRSVCVAMLVLGSCAPTLPQAYVVAHAEADRAYSAGRFDEAATKYREASQATTRVNDRDEMLFLEAKSWQRARQWQRATALYQALAKLNPGGAQADRCAFEVAEIEIAHGDPARGYALHEQALRRAPDSGIARRQLARYVAWLDESQSAAAALQWLQSNLSWLKTKELGETALFLTADRLERTNALAAARDLFVQCAHEHPYPSGALNDDALYRASLLDEKLGDPRLAIAHLRELLSNRESATMSGSYERPRYSQAQMRLAVLYRDALQDKDNARKEFRKLFNEFTTSVLRDDALWQEALVAKQSGDGEGACDAVSLLVRKLPESRFAPCAQNLCATAPKLDKPRACHAYVEREIAPATTAAGQER